jgi:DNA-binding PadR family transcriptional regulator
MVLLGLVFQLPKNQCDQAHRQAGRRVASQGPVAGQWMLKELRHHGYDVSPGTLYPILHRMERLGWLRSEADDAGGPRAKRSFYTTEIGREVLAVALRQMNELTEK